MPLIFHQSAGDGCSFHRVVETLDFREYKGRGYAHLERLADGSLSVLWRPKGEQRGSRFPVGERDPWQDFERQAKLEGLWSSDEKMLAALQKRG